MGGRIANGSIARDSGPRAFSFHRATSKVFFAAADEFLWGGWPAGAAGIESIHGIH
jgi:hypothetical protein